MIAKRIMKCFNCHPQSWPRLPDTSTHPLWQSWELTVESYIMHNVALTRGSAMVNPRNNMPFSVPSSPTFFTDQLTAFELWLDYELPSADPPARLPIVLQVLLSQLHRVRALQLLRRYLALGAEAVNLSLVVGIFPYILKLLLSASEDIKQALVSIWASIMGFDSSCRQELIRAKSQAFFIQYLKSSEAPAAQRCMAAFVLAEICDGYIEGQQTCLHNGLHKVCTSIISEDSVLASPLLKKWTCLCLYKLCEEFRWAKYLCLTEANHNQLYPLLVDGDPTVRAATVLALGELFGASALLQLSATFDKPENSTDKEHKSNPIVSTDKDLIDEELQLALQLLECCSDGSPMVRLEAVLALSKFFQQETHINYIKLVAQEVSKRLSTRKFPRKAAVIASKNDEYKSSSLTKDSVPYPWKLSHKEIMEVVEVLEEFISRSHTFNDTPDRILNKRASPSSVNNTVNTSIDKTNLSIGLAQITLDVDEDGRPRAFSNEGTFVPRTPALQAIMAQAYVQLWLAVTELQGTDPFGAVVEISTAIRNRVNAMVMVDVQRSKDLKMGKLYLENDDSYGQFVGSAVSMESARPHPFSPGGEVSYYRSSFTPNESVLSTSTDSAARLPIVYRTASPFERQASDKQADSFTNWQNSMKGTPGEGHKTVQWDASSPERMRCVSPFRPEAIERSMSDRKGSNANFIDDSDGAATAIDSSESIIINSIVKKSNFYFMTKSLFTEPEGSFDPYADPLSIEGSTMVYRNTKLNEIMKAEETILKIFRDVDERSDIHLIERKPKVSVDDMNLSKTSIVSSLSASVTKFEQKSIISLDSASNGSRRSLVMFHGFQNILAISSGKSVAIWSLEKDRSHIMDIPTRRSSVRAKGGEVGYSSSVDSSLFAPVYTPGVTSMTWINESFESLLLIGTDDGVINVWRDTANSDVHSENQGLNSSNGQSGNVNNGSGLSNGHNASFIRSSSPAPGGSSIKRGITDVGNAQPAIELATAFCALPDVAENTLGSGLIVNWQQSSGILTVGGNSTEIRVWDLGKEQHTRIFNTGIDTCLTAMTSKCGPQNQFTNSIYMDNFSSPSYVEDIVLPWTFAGFADGSVAAYDGRVHSNGGRIHYSRNHGAWINNAHLRYDIPEVITSAVNGTIKFWDLRTMRAYKTLDVQKSLLTAMCVHNCAPIMAAGSQAKFIKLLTLGGEQLGNIIKYHDGFMGQRIGAISSLAFHPYKLTLAAGCADNIVSIYSTADCS